MPAAPVQAFFRARGGFETPDSFIGWFPMLIAPGYKLDSGSGVTTVTHTLRPEITGNNHIAGNKPSIQLAINFSFLS